jgi:hypothetical protein
MAKALKYFFEFSDIDADDYKVEIWVEGFAGTATELIAGGNPLTRTYNKDVGEKYLGGIVPSVISIEAISNASFHAVDFTGQNYGDAVAVVYKNTVLQYNAIIVPFEGSDSDLNDGIYSVNLSAECGLVNLKTITFLPSGTRKKLLDVIIECINNIPYVNSFGYSVVDNVDLRDADLNKPYYYESFIEDKFFEGLSCYDVINSIIQQYGQFTFTDGRWDIKNIAEISKVNSVKRTYSNAGVLQASTTYTRPDESVTRIAGGDFGLMFSQKSVTIEKTKSISRSLNPNSGFDNPTGWTFEGFGAAIFEITNGYLTNLGNTLFNPEVDGSYAQSPPTTYFPFKSSFELTPKQELKIKFKSTKGSFIKNLRLQIIAVQDLDANFYYLTNESSWYRAVEGVGTPIYAANFKDGVEEVIPIPQVPFLLPDTPPVLSNVIPVYGEFMPFPYLDAVSNLPYKIYVRVFRPERLGDDIPAGLPALDLTTQIDYIHITAEEINNNSLNGFTKKFGVVSQKDRSGDLTIKLGVGYPSFPVAYDSLFFNGSTTKPITLYNSLPIEEFIADSYLSVLSQRQKFYQGTVIANIEFGDLLDIDGEKHRIHNYEYNYKLKQANIKTIGLGVNADTIEELPVYDSDVNLDIDSILNQVDIDMNRKYGDNLNLKFVDKNIQINTLADGQKSLSLRQDFRISRLYSTDVFLRTASDGSIQDVAEDTEGNFTLIKPAKDGTYALLEDIEDLAWLQEGNTATVATKKLGTLDNFDFNIIRNNINIGQIKSTGLDLLDNRLDVGAVQFNVATAQTVGVAKTIWNDTFGTLEFGLKGGNVNYRLGQSSIVYVKSADNAGLTKGTVVYTAGSDGTNKTVRLAQANAESTSSKTFGIIAETVTGGGKAFCITFGNIEGINTSAFAEGATIYLSPTVAGGMTTTKPSAPNHMVVVGFCLRSHATLGVIFVKVQNGFELDEIHDVAIGTLANNNLLAYESSTSLWKNKTYAELGLSSGTGTTNFVTKWSNATGGLINSQIFDNGVNVGIGTPSPTQKLEIHGGNDVGISIFNTNANFWDITNGLNGTLNFIRGRSNNFMQINQFGNVGIGTTTITQKLDVAGGARFTNDVIIGGGAVGGNSLLVTKNITGGVDASGIRSSGQIQSDVTNSAFMFRAVVNQANFALPTLIVYESNIGTISGTGTNFVNYRAAATSAGFTNVYGFQGTIASGNNRWNLFMVGTAPNHMAGSLGIGTTALAGHGIRNSKTITGGASGFSYANYSDGQIQSDVTGAAWYFRSFANTQPTAFTLPEIRHFDATQGTIGAGSSVTVQTAFLAGSTLVGASFANYGFRGNIPAGTGRWNAFMDGTAQNYFRGNVGIGINKTVPAVELDVAGTIATTNFRMTSGAAAGRVLQSDANGNASWVTLNTSGYLGTWNANTNTPTIADGTGVAGQFYIVTVAGTWNGLTFAVGDEVYYNGTIWQRIPSSFTLPVATASILGGVKISTGLSINGTGDLSVAYGVTSTTAAVGDHAHTFGGDVSGSGGTGTIALTLATVNSNVGQFTKVTVNAKGLVTAATNLIASDIPTLNQNTTGSAGLLATARNIAMTGDGTWSVTFNGSADVSGALTLADVVTAGTYRSVTINAKGLVIAGTNPTTVSGYGITDFYAQIVSGFVTGENSSVLNTDSLEVALEKLQGQINARISGNQTITLSGIVTGSGTTAITTAIADAALSIAKTSGLQTALDSKQATLSGTGLVLSTAGTITYVTNNSANWNTAFGWGNHASAGYLLASTASTTYQPLDADLTSIAGLAGTSGILRKTAANTWSLDTNSYLTANQSISITGDATGSGTTSIALTLANVATAGTYRSVTINAKGLVTSGTNPTTISGYGITDAYTKTESDGRYQGLDADLTAIGALTGTNGILRKTAANTWSLDTNTFVHSGNLIDFRATTTQLGFVAVGTTMEINGFGVINQKSGLVTIGTYRSVTVDTYGRVTAGTNPTTLAGYAITDAYTKTESDERFVLTSVLYSNPSWITSLAWSKLTGVPATFAPSAHTHAATDIVSGVIATARLASGTASASTYLRGDQTWATLPTGGITALTGDVTASGSGSVAATLATVTQANTGDFRKITIDTKGRVTGNTAVVVSDLTALLGTTRYLPYNTGVANFVTKWSNTSGGISNSQIFDNGTNIGIGNSVPDTKLHLTGNLKIDGGTGYMLMGNVAGAYWIDVPSTSLNLYGTTVISKNNHNFEFKIGLNGNYGTAGQVLTSQGSSANPTWTTISGGTLASTQIGFGSLTNVLSGSAGFTWKDNRYISITASSSNFNIGASGGLGFIESVNGNLELQARGSFGVLVSDGYFRVNELGGAGLQMVTVDNDGLFGKQAIPSGGIGNIDQVLAAGSTSFEKTFNLQNSETNPYLHFKNNSGTLKGNIIHLLDVLSFNSTTGNKLQLKAGSDLDLLGNNINVGYPYSNGFVNINGTPFKLAYSDFWAEPYTPALGDKVLFSYDTSKNAFVMQKVQVYTSPIDSRNYLVI